MYPPPSCVPLFWQYNKYTHAFCLQHVPPTARPAQHLASAQQRAALMVSHTTAIQSCATAAPTSVRPAHTAAVPRPAVLVWAGTRSMRMALDAQVIYQLFHILLLNRLRFFSKVTKTNVGSRSIWIIDVIRQSQRSLPTSCSSSCTLLVHILLRVLTNMFGLHSIKSMVNLTNLVIQWWLSTQ